MLIVFRQRYSYSTDEQIGQELVFFPDLLNYYTAACTKLGKDHFEVLSQIKGEESAYVIIKEYARMFICYCIDEIKAGNVPILSKSLDALSFNLKLDIKNCFSPDQTIFTLSNLQKSHTKDAPLSNLIPKNRFDYQKYQELDAHLSHKRKESIIKKNFEIDWKRCTI